MNYPSAGAFSALGDPSLERDNAIPAAWSRYWKRLPVADCRVATESVIVEVLLNAALQKLSCLEIPLQDELKVSSSWRRRLNGGVYEKMFENVWILRILESNKSWTIFRTFIECFVWWKSWSLKDLKMFQKILHLMPWASKAFRVIIASKVWL